MGFVLRTSEKKHYCKKCSTYNQSNKHTCVTPTDFVRVEAGSPQCVRWIALLANWDTGLWNAGMMFQVALMTELESAYVLIQDFYGNYHASIVSERAYARLKPYKLLNLNRENGVWVYVNKDYSAVILPEDVVCRLNPEAQ